MMSRWSTMTRMTSFLRLFVDKISKFHLFILYIALHLFRLIASGTNRGRMSMNKCRDAAVMPLRSFFILFSHMCLLSIHSIIQSSNISAAAPSGIFDSGQEMRCICIAWSLHFLICLAAKLCKNCFAHSMFTLSFMFLLSYSMPWLCSHSQFILFWIFGSLLIVAALLLLFVRGLISLLFLQFHCLTLCMMYALFLLYI